MTQKFQLRYAMISVGSGFQWSVEVPVGGVFALPTVNLVVASLRADDTCLGSFTRVGCNLSSDLRVASFRRLVVSRAKHELLPRVSRRNRGFPL